MFILEGHSPETLAALLDPAHASHGPFDSRDLVGAARREAEAQGCFGIAPYMTASRLYHRRVPMSSRRVLYLHHTAFPNPSGHDLQYADATEKCRSAQRTVCTLDQLGGAWVLGYENGCRGWVAPPRHGSPNAARTACAVGDVLSRRGFPFGLWDGDGLPPGVYCCVGDAVSADNPLCEPQRGGSGRSISKGGYRTRSRTDGLTACKTRQGFWRQGLAQAPGG